jgi:hypothetical protein
MTEEAKKPHWDTVKSKVKQKHVMGIFIDLSNAETQEQVAEGMKRMFHYAKYGKLL